MPRAWPVAGGAPIERRILGAIAVAVVAGSRNLFARQRPDRYWPLSGWLAPHADPERPFTVLKCFTSTKILQQVWPGYDSSVFVKVQSVGIV